MGTLCQKNLAFLRLISGGRLRRATESTGLAGSAARGRDATALSLALLARRLVGDAALALLAISLGSRSTVGGNPY